MKIKPLTNHVLFRAVEAEKMTKSGIVIPDTADKGRPMQGTVVAVGPGKADKDGVVRPVAVKEGDLVLFKKYGPDEIELEGEKYLIGDEDDILAVLEA